MLEKEIESLKRHFEIDEDNLHKEILEQPALFLRWAIRCARASRKLEESRVVIRVVAAEEMKKIREEHFLKTGKELAATAPTEKTDLPLQDRYKEFIQRTIELEEEVGILTAAREAARQRKDMLIQYSLMVRDEIKGDIIIRNREKE